MPDQKRRALARIGLGSTGLGPALGGLLTVTLCLALALGPAAAATRPKPPALPADPAAAPPSSVSIDAQPTWVAPVAAPPLTAIPAAPMQIALLDYQVRLHRGETSRFMHTVRVLNDASSLGEGAQVQIDYDPGYQHLALHRVDLWRDGRRVDKLDRRKLRILNRETQLERRIIDGRVTASLVLDDVRVGDRIETSYTLRGANPVFAGKFVDSQWSAASSAPVALFQYRLLAPAEREIRLKLTQANHQVTTKVAGGLRETLIRRSAVAQVQTDAYTPPAAYFGDLVQLSEFADWHEVAAWAAKLFVAPAEPSPGVSARAAAIQAATSDPAEQVRRALDFVQTEVRYFGTETGAYSHQPAAPETVLQQRFGDCKDKVALLIALLHRLGIEAEPVLASAAYRSDVAAMLPSPSAFDHAVARVVVNDKLLWLDGTRGFQTGSLAGGQAVGLGKGLIAIAATTALSDFPGTADELRVLTTDTFHVPRLADEPSLESRSTYYGEMAELMRSMRAGQPREDFEKQILADYFRQYSAAEQAAPVQVIEDPAQNAVSIVVQLKMHDFWRFPQKRMLAGDYAMGTLMSPLRLPSQAPRSLPYQIGYPGIYRQSVDFQFAENVFDKPASNHFSEHEPYFDHELSYAGTADSQHVEAELHFADSAVPAADWANYKAQVIKLWPKLSGSMTVSTISADRVERLKANLKALDEGLRSGKVKVKTPAQVEFRARLLMLDAQLDSDRLAPKLRAQALVERAIQLDQLDRASEAVPDLQAALQLDPSSADAHAAYAVNAVMRGENKTAVAQATQAIGLDASPVAPRYTRAYANYFDKAYAPARADLQEVLQSRSEVERSYAAIWLYLAARGSGDDGAAAIKPYAPTAAKPAWPYPVLQFFNGAIDFDQALAAAKESGRSDPGKLCELYFYAAEKALLEGDAAQARQHFQRSLDTGVFEFSEYAFSLREIERLAAR